MVSYVYDGIEIVWSQHAIERIRERFDFDCKIPNEDIVRRFRSSRIDRFTIATRFAVFGCKVIGPRTLRVRTVFRRDGQKLPCQT
jgi:hypothetical protein